LVHTNDERNTVFIPTDDANIHVDVYHDDETGEAYTVIGISLIEGEAPVKILVNDEYVYDFTTEHGYV
jgi:hypothetical protein